MNSFKKELMFYMKVKQNRCYEYYIVPEQELDLDDKFIRDLLELCRKAGKSIDYRDCEDCKLKFRCWTHRKKEEE